MDFYEILKFFLSSFIGGVIGGWLSFRLYIAQKRFDIRQQDTLEKREALREMLPILQIILRDMHNNWEMPEGSKESSAEHIANLQAKISQWRSIFVNDDDVLAIIREFSSLVGMTNHGFYGPDKNEVKKPGQIMNEATDAINEQIIKLNRTLSGKK